MKKKSKLIIAGSVIGVVVVLILVLATAFTLQNIDFQLTSMYTTGTTTTSEYTHLFKTQSVSEVETGLYKSAKFNKGGNLLFMNFGSQIDNMEKAYPYVKIEKIVRRFPNKITVYYSEREPIAMLQSDNLNMAYYIVDTSLKVLDIVPAITTEYNLPVLSCQDTIGTYSAGQTVNNSTLKGYLADFVTAAYSVNADTSSLYQVVLTDVFKIQSIQLYTYTSDNQTGSSAVHSDFRCKFVALADNGAQITFDVFSINQNFTGADFLSKIKAALLAFKNVQQEGDLQAQTVEVYYSQEFSAIAANIVLDSQDGTN